MKGWKGSDPIVTWRRPRPTTRSSRGTQAVARRRGNFLTVKKRIMPLPCPGDPGNDKFTEDHDGVKKADGHKTPKKVYVPKATEVPGPALALALTGVQFGVSGIVSKYSKVDGMSGIQPFRLCEETWAPNNQDTEGGLTNRTEKILHTGDTNSLDRCG